MKRKRVGVKKVIYSSPFIPPEWIAAYGLMPSRRSFIKKDKDLCANSPINIETGVCPYMREFVNQAVDSEDILAIILTTTCDQMRRGADLVNLYTQVPCFLMHVPSSLGSSGVGKLYIKELERLGRFLVSLGGTKPMKEDLACVMLEYENKRKELLSKQRMLSAGDLANVPIGLIGGPLTEDHFELFDIFAGHGASVVIDGLETGERTLPAMFDKRCLQDEPMQALAEAYFGFIPDIFERPNNRIFLWMKNEIKDHNIRGMVIIRYVWCDKWHAEVQRFRESLPVPLLDIELNDNKIGEHTKNRIQAFMEALR